MKATIKFAETAVGQIVIAGAIGAVWALAFVKL